MLKTGKKIRKAGNSGPKKSLLPAWIFFLGLGIGLAVAAAVYVSAQRPQPEPAAGPAPVVTPAAPATPAEPAPVAEPEPTPAPREEKRVFTFYQMLPNFEVVIPEQEPEVRRDTSPSPVSSDGVYILQAGSFSTYEDADRRKAELALLGVVSTIQRISVEEKSYHRVRIGPISDLDELNRVRGQLQNADMEFLLIKVGE